MKVSVLTQALLGLSSSTGAANIQYSTMKGYFLQDENSTCASTFNYVCLSPSFDEAV